MLLSVISHLAPFLAQMKKENTYLQASNKSLEVTGKARGQAKVASFYLKDDFLFKISSILQRRRQGKGCDRHCVTGHLTASEVTRHLVGMS